MQVTGSGDCHQGNAAKHLSLEIRKRKSSAVYLVSIRHWRSSRGSVPNRPAGFARGTRLRISDSPHFPPSKDTNSETRALERTRTRFVHRCRLHEGTRAGGHRHSGSLDDHQLRWNHHESAAGRSLPAARLAGSARLFPKGRLRRSIEPPPNEYCVSYLARILETG